MFEWRPDLDEVLLPYRGQGTPIQHAKPVDDKKLFASAAKVSIANFTPPESLARMIQTREAPDSPERFAHEADLFLLACFHKPEPFAALGVDRWVQRYGIAGAIEIYTLVGKWKPAPIIIDGLTRRLAAVRLRRWLAHASEVDYGAARDFVVAHAGLPHGMPHWKPNDVSPYNTGREVMAFLFPDHRPLFEAAMAQLTECKWTSSYLLSSVTSSAELAALAEEIGYVDWDWSAVTLAHTLREDALAALVAYSQSSNQVVGVARALTAYACPEAAAALALYLPTKPAFAILQTYFAQHRALAPRALEPALQSKKKAIRDAAAKLLA